MDNDGCSNPPLPVNVELSQSNIPVPSISNTQQKFPSLKPEVLFIGDSISANIDNNISPIVLKQSHTATINPTLSDSKLGLDDVLQAIDQCNNQDTIYKDLNNTNESKGSRHYAKDLNNSETNNSSSSQNDFTLVSRGAKPGKCHESFKYLNVSNRFTTLEIEPCIESFDGHKSDENRSSTNPAISKILKKKKKKKTKRKTTLEYSKVNECFSSNKHKSDNLVNCERRCNFCFKAHFPQSKFCRWSEKKNNEKVFQKTKTTTISEDTINLVKKKIQSLQDGIETAKDVQLKEINDSFFKRSQNATDPLNYPDLLGTEVCKFSPSKPKESCNLEDTSKLKLKGGGGEHVKVKKYISDIKNINLVLNSFRSSSMLTSLNVHNKCPANSFCNLCLLRSSIFKINLQTGRQSIKPVEVECQPFCTVEMMHNELLKCVLDNASQSVPSFYSIITPQWSCSCCRSADTNNTENIIILDNEARNRKITHLVEEKYNCIKQKHLEEALEHFVCHDNDFIMSLKEEQTSCVFYSSQTFELNLDAVL